MEEEVDFDRLREDLIDYFGTATSSFPLAYSELLELFDCSDDELIKISLNNNFNLDDYVNHYNK